MRKIEIDDEIFALLQQLAVPFVDTNSVLRRELLTAQKDSQSDTSEPMNAVATQFTPVLHNRTGELMPYITSGEIRPVDILIYTKRNGESYRGTVTNDGWIRANGNTYASPSSALKACLGHDVNRWKTWTHQRTNHLLNTFRE